MGASSGIGLALAETLASRGVRVGLAARKTEKLEALKQLYPDNVEFAAIDVTKKGAIQHLHHLITLLGGMDIYIHVAGIGYENPDLDPEKEVNIFETNTIGFVRCVSAAYNYFRDNCIKGQIVCITSVAGTNGIARLSAYSASKAACQKWLTALQQLTAANGSGITITDIRPAWIRTPLLNADKHYPMEMTLDYALPRILKAIVEKKRVAVIDWRWDILVGLWRAIPNVIYTKINLPITI